MLGPTWAVNVPAMRTGTDCASPIIKAPSIIKIILTRPADEVKTVVDAMPLETKNVIQAGRITAKIAKDTQVRASHNVCA